MSELDDVMRAVVARAESTQLARRDALLDELTERVQAGGADVADAPAATPLMVAASQTEVVHLGSRARRTIRIAGFGVTGWAALAVGTAAAAAATAGVWWLFDPDPSPGPTPEPTSLEEPIVRAVAEPTTDDDLPGGSTARTALADPPGDEVTGTHAPTPQAAPEGVPTQGSGQATVPDVVEGINNTVTDLLPEGPVADTVAPIIDGVNVSGLTAWLLDSLWCGAPAPVEVVVTDNVAVTSVGLRVTAVGGLDASMALTDAGGGTWTGALSPLSVVELGLLNDVVHVRVEARDAAGNVATATHDVSVQVGSC